MEIPLKTVPFPVESKFIRIPIAGPKPWNTLVFIQCSALGLERGEPFYRFRIRFSTDFKIGKFEQKDLDWYQKHTYISATVFLNYLSVNPEMNLIAAAEDIKGYVDSDGRIGFEIQFAMQWSGYEFAFDSSISAYVLLYEKQDPLPPVPPTKPGWMPKIEELPSQFRRRRDFRITGDASVLDK